VDPADPTLIYTFTVLGWDGRMSAGDPLQGRQTWPTDGPLLGCGNG
jgi:hypothetical protein